MNNHRDKIIELMKSEQLANYQLALTLSEGRGYSILAEICDFLVQSYDDKSHFSYEIQCFLWRHLEDYPNHKLSFDWYQPDMIDCPPAEDLPAGIGALKSLRYLDLSNMDLCILPESFSFLRNLVTLNLSLNRLKYFPLEIKGFVNLKSIDLSYNLIHTICPESVSVLPALESLNLEGNEIKFLPKEMECLESLKDLNLKENLLGVVSQKLISNLLPNCHISLSEFSSPNIFAFATSELSQDAFFAWLIKWADYKYYKCNPALNSVAQEFIKSCIGEDWCNFSKVEVGRQRDGIDIWAMIDEKILIVIEDKVNAVEHSDQLNRYKQKSKEWYPDKDIELKFVYLKTGNEPLGNIKSINDKGYKVLTRPKLIDIFSKHAVQDDIFNAFFEHIVHLENRTNSYTQFGNIISDWLAAEGLFLALEEKLDAATWSVVNNPSGGFLGFWYPGMGNQLFYEIKIQIENRFGRGIKVVIKVSDSDISKGKLYQALDGITTLAQEKYQLDLSKPDRFSTGKRTASLAYVEGVFPDNEQDSLDIDILVKKLNKIEELINEYCSNT